MPVLVNCPHCDKKLKVPDNLVGKMVKCPTCSKTFTAEATDAPPSSAEEEATSRSGDVVPSRKSGEEEDRPRRRVRDDDDDEEEERPRRRRLRDEDDDDDYDDRPRRRGRGAPHRGTLILVLGILSIVFTIIGVILGPIAWVMGNNDMKEIRAGRMDREGEGTTNAGRICGIVGTVLGALTCLGCIAYMTAIGFVISHAPMH